MCLNGYGLHSSITSNYYDQSVTEFVTEGFFLKGRVKGYEYDSENRRLDQRNFP
jgi:hypothetical protein